MNTGTMATKWPGMSIQAENITEIINYVFSSIFVIEALIKLMAYKSRYFRDPWNIFDFFIVTSSVLFIIVKEVFNVNLG
jgi:hypothetical protein